MIRTCASCGAPIGPDEVGANHKLSDPKKIGYLCLACLSLEIGADEQKLRKRIESWKKMGCLYFT